MLQLWKVAPCFLVLCYYCTPLQPPLICVNQHNYLLLSEALITFILVNGIARFLDMGLLL